MNYKMSRVFTAMVFLSMNASARSEEAPTAIPPREYKGSSYLFPRPVVPTVKRFAKTLASNGQTGSPISSTHMTAAYKSVQSNQHPAVEAASAC
jgi:hypothetical protein